MSTSDENGGGERGPLERLGDVEQMALVPRQIFENFCRQPDNQNARDALVRASDVKRSFFELERGDYQYRYKGVLRSLENFYNFERGDAVAVLPYDLERDEVFLVQQVRPPVYGKTDDGWLIETVAGMPRDADLEEKSTFDGLRRCALRELHEETNIDIVDQPDRLWPRSSEEGGHLTQFFPSPGGSSEEIYLFLADVTGRIPTHLLDAGNRIERELTIIHRYARKEFLKLVEDGWFRDSKIYAAAVMLEHFFKRGLAQTSKGAQDKTVWRFLPAEGAAERTVELLPGNILKYRDFDVWANSEDPTLAMNRMNARSISSIIRRYGATWYSTNQDMAGHRATTPYDEPLKHVHERLLEDTIALALAEEKRRKADRVELGDVFMTTSGNLLLSHNVRWIAHLVAVENDEEQGPVAIVKNTAEFVRKLLDRIDDWNRRRALSWRRAFEQPLRSVILPFFGAGTGGGKLELVANGLIEGVERFWSDPAHRGTAISKIGLSCFSQDHIDDATVHLRRSNAFERRG